ncbi:protein MKS1-like [Phalaenopsis equestris]|uniref:protein MKS1-like n=1 Tax=Phalaenopsis equestris TaxID=78828 RepID=UPI0009E517A4|nr:protein MKS1-like [Phalaenopsis equestris]
MPSASGRSLQGPRPHPLKISKDSWKAGKSPSVIAGDGGSRQSPMITYLHSPKVIHAKPQEFMSLVQQLTGKHASELQRAPGSGGGSGLDLEKEMEEKREFVEEDPLLLTLGQSPSASAWISASSSMVSPGLFLSSPNLNSCLQEFGSSF